MTPLHAEKKIRFSVPAVIATAAAALLLAASADASHISYDPFADAVTSTSAGVSDKENAVGEPDGKTTALGGVGKAITLDMGAGEEGTGPLRAHFGSIGAAKLRIDFLDDNQRSIAEETRTLVRRTGPTTETFDYSFSLHGQAYRYVTLTSHSVAGVELDAVEATGAIGALDSTDTDGDGMTDRVEQHEGRNPQAADAPRPRDDQDQPMPNPVPPPEKDLDGDGMDDEWERTHGLNPDDDGDAARDNDGDGLSNLNEYVWDADPNAKDTDGDGMDDRWERDNGLMVARNDAAKDPDGDGATNVQEYGRGTDPQKTDDAAANAAYGWLTVFLLVAIVTATYLIARPKGVVATKR